ncbi:MAG: xylulokinase [Phycisphaerales bacterium]
MALLLGIDIGTSATKAVLCEEDGAIVASCASEHPIARPAPGWSEQSPEDWWDSTIRAVRGVLERAPGAAERVAAIGLSGQMHGSVLLGASGTEGGRAAALRPAILWNDQRSARECAEIEAAVGGRRRLVELSGNAALPGFTLPKLLWLRRHEPELWARVRQVCLPKDFIAMRLTGALATDVGDAAGTLLLDVERRTWSPALLGALGMDEALLPPVVESATVVGGVTRWAAERTGMREGVPVATGSGDNMCGAVGAGVVAPGVVLASLGTSGVILAHSERALRDLPATGPRETAMPGRLHCMCAATDPRGWCVTGCMLSAGGALAWARGVLAPEASFDDLLREAERAPAGCEGLVFLPHLTGERCPHADPLARGGWIGLTARHTRAHLIRSVVEGVTFGMGEILDLVRGLGIRPHAVRLTGGGNRSRLWRQLQADVFETPVETSDDEGGCALGAAIIGASAIGRGPVGELAALTVRVGEKIEPQTPACAQTRAAKQLFAHVFADLRMRFPEMAGVAGAGGARAGGVAGGSA